MDPRGHILELAARLRERALTIAVAESCTGGMLGAALSALPGSSRYFAGGVIAYENRVKSGLLGVPEEIVSREGAVSRPVAELMASGVKTLMGTDIGVAVTGIAGPGGGTDRKPVGLVYIAVAGSRVECRRFRFAGSREEIRVRAVEEALALAATPGLGPSAFRVFVAAPLPPDVAARFSGFSRRLAVSGGGARPVPPENLHITLRFLGEVPAARVDEIDAVVAAAAGIGSSFSAEFGRCGFFPSRGRPRVVWAALVRGGAEFEALASALDRGLAEAGFPARDREFLPHLTLLRPRPGASPARLSRELESLEPETAGRFRVDLITFFRSTITPRGAVYRPFSEHALPGGSLPAEGV
ncbi:MAG TPA: RNA 2',3'-cyclic phosphodiesterase [bacterium]|nr:RNA 2',3'-cyclic phosphodiesterase [bacterium]HPQ66789.1 RNA 2',3'-cyclic phosphodiesterase [bacterium]